MIATKADSSIKCSDLTVVVAFRNEYHNLSILLKNITRLKILPSKFIFVNDHSQDDWSELFEKMNSNLIIHILIDLIIIGFLFYIYRVNKSYFIVTLLTLLLITLLIPEILLPSPIWDYLLNKMTRMSP